MVRTGILTTVSAVLLTSLLSAQEQPQKKDTASRWVFADARTATQLVTLVQQDGLPPSHARELTWAICPATVTAVSLAPDGPLSGTYSYNATESVPLGSHCLLIDSPSHEAIFSWGGGSEPSPVKRACAMGFPQAAEALTGRKVDSCYLIGAYGTGAVELIEYTRTSPEDGLAALLVDNLRTPTGDPQYWIATFPAGETGWASNAGQFHPEQFQHLFTLIDDGPNDPSTNVRFVGVEWDRPEGAELILYRPVGNELKEVIVNYEPVGAQAVAQR
jgi:hypothetical protein